MSTSEAGIRAVIERYAAAWLAGDLATLFDCYHDDFTLHYSGSNALSGDHVGKAASLATLAEFGRRTERDLVAIVATMAGRERGALVVREALGGGRDRIEVERVLVYAVRDGRLVECWVYDTDPTAIDRLIGSA